MTSLTVHVDLALNGETSDAQVLPGFTLSWTVTSIT